ncbi:MAG: hypothetical protein EB127_32160 [Alphaproteobacteria bacterium]|nr:hypothetical protein [Alphaproteobacteria bacterium]
MSGGMSYDEFIKKLYKKAKSKGQAFVNAIPESTKKEHNLKATEEEVIETKEVEQIQPEPSEEQADSQLTQPESEPEPEVQACDEEAYGEKKMVNIEIEVNINKNQDENNEEDNDEEGEEEDSQDNPSEELQEIVCPECGNSPCTCDTENDQADSNEVKTDETNESEAEYYANDLIKKLGISCVKESDAGLEAMRPSEDPYFQNKVYSKPGDLKN